MPHQVLRYLHILDLHFLLNFHFGDCTRKVIIELLLNMRRYFLTQNLIAYQTLLPYFQTQKL